MKITLFNDTHEDWSLHIGSERGVNGESRIPQRNAVTFEGPDGCDVFVKVWGSCALVRPMPPEEVDAEERQCILCEAPIPDDGGIDVCGRCIAERQS
jgi:hypothetical protein